MLPCWGGPTRSDHLLWAICRRSVLGRFRGVVALAAQRPRLFLAAAQILPERFRQALLSFGLVVFRAHRGPSIG
jgi:hypothetical protein